MRHRTDRRIDVRVPTLGSHRFHRELRAFACFCIARIERELGANDSWVLTIRPHAPGFEAEIEVTRKDAHVHLDRVGLGRDATLAIWDAMCNVEQRLREEVHAA